MAVFGHKFTLRRHRPARRACDDQGGGASGEGGCGAGGVGDGVRMVGLGERTKEDWRSVAMLSTASCSSFRRHVRDGDTDAKTRYC